MSALLHPTCHFTKNHTDMMSKHSRPCRYLFKEMLHKSHSNTECQGPQERLGTEIRFFNLDGILQALGT